MSRGLSFQSLDFLLSNFCLTTWSLCAPGMAAHRSSRCMRPGEDQRPARNSRAYARGEFCPHLVLAILALCMVTEAFGNWPEPQVDLSLAQSRLRRQPSGGDGDGVKVNVARSKSTVSAPAPHVVTSSSSMLACGQVSMLSLSGRCAWIPSGGNPRMFTVGSVRGSSTPTLRVAAWLLRVCLNPKRENEMLPRPLSFSTASLSLPQQQAVAPAADASDCTACNTKGQLLTFSRQRSGLV